ncbi:ATP-binding cassette domain-containing protein [Streptomyces sp. Edi4]|uniref:ATP-binding cassette domain-containing protein n=1 Tax=Streptomyces sp. Edi4 TaxID=3162527 RepID=UPI003305EBA3
MQPPADDHTRARAPLAPATGSPDATPSAAGPALAISTRGLVKSYPGPDGTTTHAVHGLDLDVLRGETYAFLGPNGAGKSTTIALLCALARPTAGQATVAGIDVIGQPDQVRAKVGLLFQNSALDPDLTAQQNLYVHARLYGLSRRHARLRTGETLEKVGLADRRRSLVRTLSGGMRRRLELARGLLHAPEILFLDEPTTGLDPHARAQVWDYLRVVRDQHGSTLFITTHYLEEAENCDRLGIIDHGRLVAQGTACELRAAIGDDRVALRTSDNASARQIVAGAVPPGVTVTGDSEGVTLRISDGSTWIPRLCAALEAHAIAVHAASATPPTLDDVFFHHTGRSIHTSGTHRAMAAAPSDPVADATEEAS